LNRTTDDGRRTTLRIAVTGVFVAALSAGSPLAAQEDQTAKVEAATEAAAVWLVLIDEGAYDESWDVASSVIQGAMHKDEWGPTMRQARAPYDPISDRELVQSQFMTSVPNMPEGEYVRLIFATDTASGKVNEIVALIYERDGWSVMGYFLQPQP
jgi:Protein of unknown function (DUF4019)